MGTVCPCMICNFNCATMPEPPWSTAGCERTQTCDLWMTDCCVWLFQRPVVSGTWWHSESEQGLLGFLDHLGCFHGCQTVHCFVFVFFWGKRACGHWLTCGDWMTTLNMNAGGDCLTAHFATVATLWKEPAIIWTLNMCLAGTTKWYISDLVTWQMSTLSPTER